MLGLTLALSSSPVAAVTQDTENWKNSSVTVETPADEPGQSIQNLENEWGIELVRLGLSAAGYMIDFRYKLIDPEKADSLFNRKTKLYLVHQKTSKTIPVYNPAKVGPMRQTAIEPKSGRNYFIMFANPGRLIQPGDKITLIVGDSKIENLTISGGSVSQAVN